MNLKTYINWIVERNLEAQSFEKYHTQCTPFMNVFDTSFKKKIQKSSLVLGAEFGQFNKYMKSITCNADMGYYTWWNLFALKASQ